MHLSAYAQASSRLAVHLTKENRYTIHVKARNHPTVKKYMHSLSS
jgi:hypothetical protein